MGISRFALAAAAAAFGMSGTAQAVPATVDADGRALILVPLTLTKLSDLHFGTVVPSSLSGTVTIDAYTGARTFTGGAMGVASDAGYRAEFAGAGSVGQEVIVTVDPPTVLTNALGQTVTVLGTPIDGPSTRVIDATRAFFLGVGGTLAIAADQPEGDYSADFTVTANYQ